MQGEKVMQGHSTNFTGLELLGDGGRGTFVFRLLGASGTRKTLRLTYPEMKRLFDQLSHIMEPRLFEGIRVNQVWESRKGHRFSIERLDPEEKIVILKWQSQGELFYRAVLPYTLRSHYTLLEE